jgi:hypothetical protein
VPLCRFLCVEKAPSGGHVWAMLSQCIMKIPGVFVNIASGAIQRPDAELNKETAVLCASMPRPTRQADNQTRYRYAELANGSLYSHILGSNSTKSILIDTELCLYISKVYFW